MKSVSTENNGMALEPGRLWEAGICLRLTLGWILVMMPGLLWPSFLVPTAHWHLKLLELLLPFRAILHKGTSHPIRLGLRISKPQHLNADQRASTARKSSDCF